jgi:hypothetical protein
MIGKKEERLRERKGRSESRLYFWKVKQFDKSDIKLMASQKDTGLMQMPVLNEI